LDLAKRLSEPQRSNALHDALATARAATLSDERAQILMNLATDLAELNFAQQAWEAVQALWDADDQTKASVSNASLPEPLGQQALDVVLRTGNDTVRVRSLAILASHLAEPLRSQVLQQALALVQEIESPTQQIPLLKEVLPYLPEPLRNDVIQKVFVSTRTLSSESHRIHALVYLAPHLPAPLLQEGLEIVQMVQEISD
jgi:hypothetical protein